MIKEQKYPQKIQKLIDRDLFNQITKWLYRKEIFSIRGPRQSGKTTFLSMVANFLKEKKGFPKENITVITLEDRDILEKLAQDPKVYIENILSKAKKPKKVYFFIDEAQYLPEAGQKLKLIYDLFGPKIKMIISGSSSLELKNRTAKYLVGRLFSFFLWPLVFSEFLGYKADFFKTWQEKQESLYDFLIKDKDYKEPLKDIWSKDLEKFLEEYIIFGGYPEVVNTKDIDLKKTILKNIYDTYVDRDIVDLLRLKSVSGFRNIVKLLAAQMGSLVNYNELSSDSGVYFQELKHFISILEETYLINSVKPYFTNPSTEIKKNPKIYFIDSGLRNFLLNDFNPLHLRTNKGALVENFVFSELFRNLQDKAEIKYWRTIAKAEVDFIIEKRDNEIIPVEVKFSNFSEPKISRSFRSFLEQYQPKRALLLTKGFWGKMKVGKTIIKFAPVWYI